MLRRLIHTGLVIAALAAIAGSAYGAIGRGEGAESFAAAFDARALAAPTVKSCRGLGSGGQKLEGRYQGTMTIGGEELALNFTLEALVDRSTGLGTAEGTWQLAQPSEPDLVARGELVAVVKTGEAIPPDPEADPPDPDLELQGLLIGAVSPPDPEMPAQRLLGNFAASLEGGALNFAGAVGDPTGLSSNPAVLLPAVKC